MSKKNLREEILAKRLALSPERVESHSIVIQERLIKSSLWPSSGRVGLYAAIKNEVQTHKLFQMGLEKGLHIYFPRVEQGILFYEVNGPEDLQTGAWTIPEPIIKKCEPLPEEEKLDLLVVPGLVFGKNGFRLGYGKGFYDKFLSQGLAKKACGLAFDFQIADHIEPDPWDCKMDHIITERHEWSFERK